MDSNPHYPSQYESRHTLKNGSSVFLRPIKPSDSPLILSLFDKLSDNARYLRFLRHMEELPQDMLYRFTHVDYMSEFALVAVLQENGGDAIAAVSRYAYGGGGEPADLAEVVRDDMQNVGLGALMLKKIVEIGREHGIDRFTSMMDSQNKAMKHILAKLGYRVSYSVKNGVYLVDITA
jgi:RimJ/RimL family protein N-acetyltransferase